MNLSRDKAQSERRRAGFRRAVAALLALATGAALTPASATPSPETQAMLKATDEAWQDARASATSVVVVRIISIERPKASGTARCPVSAEVTDIERGMLHRPGQRITFKVLCSRPYSREELAALRAGQTPADIRRQAEATSYQLPPPPRPPEPSPFSFLAPAKPPLNPVTEPSYDWAAISRMPYARVFLDGTGDLVFGQYQAFEQLPAPSPRP